ncbi:MAG: RNA-directed DNA polymerase [Clostridia bacterium]|nr:RNA-directed DNA polymerase [Clostridia bacterium]
MNKEEYLQELKNGLAYQGYDSRYIQACFEYAQNLLIHGLPVVFDVHHLSLLLGMTTKQLNAYIFGSGKRLYSTKHISKKDGGVRVLSIPCETLKYIQRWILDNILKRMYISECCKGFVDDCSILDNASCHLGAEVILNMDIKDFFPSISLLQVYRVFRYYGYTQELSYVMAKLCTYRDQLPQGSPASPYLSNIIALKIDKRLMALAESYGAHYTRYADDITISGFGCLEKMIPIISSVISEEGFVVNSKKTRVARKGQRQEVTGLIINSGKACVPKEYKRKIFQEIYYCQKFGVTNHQEHIGDDHRYYKEHLYGKAYYVHMIEPHIGKKMLSELDKVNWEV